MTAIDRSKVTPEQFEAWLFEIADRDPERVNPTGEDERCVYTDPEDSSCHCVIGQVLAEHDPEVLDRMAELMAEYGQPHVRNPGATALLRAAGYRDEVAMMADTWQAHADGQFRGDEPIPWGEAAEQIRLLRNPQV